MAEATNERKRIVVRANRAPALQSAAIGLDGLRAVSPARPSGLAPGPIQGAVTFAEIALQQMVTARLRSGLDSGGNGFIRMMADITTAPESTRDAMRMAAEADRPSTSGASVQHRALHEGLRGPSHLFATATPSAFAKMAEARVLGHTHVDWHTVALRARDSDLLPRIRSEAPSWGGGTTP